MRLHRRAMVLGWCLAAACTDDAASAGSGQSTAVAGSSTSASGGAGSASAGSTGTTGSSLGPATGTTATSAGPGTTGPALPDTPLCEEIDFALVVDRQASVYGEQDRAALAAFFDDVVAATGARVRILPNGGVEQVPTWRCDFATDAVAGGNTLVWGESFESDPSAPAALDCILDGTKNVPSGTGADGDWMFTGLMFPLLEHADWPSPDASITMAMLIAQRDDDQNNMYARPGMAAEAFLRLAGEGDRRRVGAYTAGRDADQLHTFALSLNERSRHYDFDAVSFADSLQDWLPHVVAQCEDHDRIVPPPAASGCQHIDILFVIDGSFSMAQEQAALRDGAFVAFAEALEAELVGLQDFRVGVISSQPGDVVLHTHRDMPATPPGPATDCGLPAGQSWIEGPSADLAAQFDCLAATDAVEDLEYTAHNAALALTESANAGFVRDDSVLLVVMLTDEDTQQFAVDRVQIRSTILEAVGGDLSRIVVLGIAGDQGVFEMPKTTCNGVFGTASPGRRLSSIVFSFREQGMMRDICTGDLEGAFDAALTRLVATCEAFEPG